MTSRKEDGSSTLNDGDKCVWLKINGSSVTGGHDYLVFMNMYSGEVSFTVPVATNGVWKRVVDTQSFFESEYNCWSPETGETIPEKYGVKPYSVVILMCVSSDQFGKKDSGN